MPFSRGWDVEPSTGKARLAFARYNNNTYLQLEMCVWVGAKSNDIYVSSLIYSIL
jgi:hypothetical protein